MTSLHNGDERGRFVDGSTHADAAVVVVTYNSASDISLLIDDLRVAAQDRKLRVIIVDNQSSDGTAEIVGAHADVKLVEPGGNLGFAGGINVAMPFAEPCDAVLFLNPDMRLKPDAVTRLLEALVADVRVGAVVPRTLDKDEVLYHSLRYEPSLTRALGDGFFGSKRWRNRPGILSEFDYRPASYLEAHDDVDWASGAALLIPSVVAREVGAWNEGFFLYSEEVDYFRRIRMSGRRIRFEPSAVVKHRGWGSGRSSAHDTLDAVNRIRYIEQYHGRGYSTLFRAAVALAEALRSYDAGHRHTLAVVLNRGRWHELLQATKPAPLQHLSGSRQRGAVIVPAYNEATVIKRAIAPLSQAAVEGFIELIVVCNGCTDDSANVARSVPGVQVLELEQASKPAALNAGDDVATLWPRLYLDADVQISADAAFAVLDRLAQGVLVARPRCEYDSRGSSALVRSYYRVRDRVGFQHKSVMWAAGVYGLNEKGHERFGSFPAVTGDDLYVDTRFDAHEKAVVATDPSVRIMPVDVRSLVAILSRHHRGNIELAARNPVRAPRTGKATARAVLGTIRGPRSAADAAVWIGIALAARWRARRSMVAWERDETSRSKR